MSNENDDGGITAQPATPRIKHLPRMLTLVDTDMPRSVLVDTWLPTSVAVGVSSEAVHLLIDIHDDLEEVGRPPESRTIPKANLIRVQTDLRWNLGAALDLIVRDPAQVRLSFWIRFGSDESYWIEALSKLFQDELGLMVAPF